MVKFLKFTLKKETYEKFETSLQTNFERNFVPISTYFKGIKKKN